MTKAKTVVSSQSSVVSEIALAHLFISEDETRKTFDKAALQELAGSIDAGGVLEPLLVRPHLEKLRAETGQPDGLPQGQLFEIVAGQRRFLAAQIAGKESVPCIVREMTDEEAQRVRITSNLQRENLSAMDEAEAYGKMMERPDATVEGIAAELAKPMSYIARRLQLLKVIVPVREALKAGAIEIGHALELARLDSSHQTRLLSHLDVGFSYQEPHEREEDEDEDEDLIDLGVCRYCKCTKHDPCVINGANCSWADEDKTVCTNPDCLLCWNAAHGAESIWKPTLRSVAQLRQQIAKTSLKVLSTAPFPLDAAIDPMPCTECPKRSGNAALLFEDCAQDTCTDRQCFDGKLRAWIRSELEAAEQQKRSLLKLSDYHFRDHDMHTVFEWNVCLIGLGIEDCKSSEDAIWINGRFIGHRTKICRDANCATHHARSRSGGEGSRNLSPAASEKQKAERKKAAAKLRQAKEYRSSLFTSIAQAKTSTTGVAPEPLLALVKYAIERSDGTLKPKAAELLGWDKKLLEGYSKEADKRFSDHLRTLTPSEAVKAALLFAISSSLTVHEYASDSRPEGLEDLARMYGVDLKVVRGEKSAAKAKPAPAKKAEPKKLPAQPAKKAAAKKPAAKSVKKAARKGGAK